MSEASSSDERSSRIWASKRGLVVATVVAVAVVGGVGMWIFADRAGTLAEQVFADIEEVEIVEEINVGDDGDEATPVAPIEPEPAPPESERLEARQFEVYRELYEDLFSDDPVNVVHMTVDRPAYRPGQPVRWKVWVLSAGDFGAPRFDRPGSRAEYEVELVDAGGNVVADSAESLVGGAVDGQFEIGDDAAGGGWTLRVRDHGGDLVFERPLLVTDFEPPRFLQDVDFERDGYRQGEEVRADVEVRRDTGDSLAERTLEGYFQVAGSHVADLEIALDTAGMGEVSFELPSVIEADDAALVLSVEEGGAVESEVWPIPLALEDVEVTFHPEGGDLVEGLTSRVYFEATDRSGEPVKLKGSVVDDRGREVAKVETEHRGRGRFELTPRAEREYALEVSHSGVETDYVLPEAKPEGCVMRLYDDVDSQEDSLRVATWCSEEKKVGILGAMADEMFDVAAMIAGPDEPAVTYLRPENDQWPRPAGVVRVTALYWDLFQELDDSAYHDLEALDEKLTPEILAERVAFRGRRAQMDIDIELDRDVYHPGQTLEMEITTRGPDGVTVDAGVTLTAVDDRVHARADHLEAPSILGQLLLEADDLHFWADADEIDDYFDLYDGEAQGLDLLMGTRGWRGAEKREKYTVDGGERTIETTQRARRERDVLVRRRTARERPERPRGLALDGDADDSAGVPMGFGTGHSSDFDSLGDPDAGSGVDSSPGSAAGGASIDLSADVGFGEGADDGPSGVVREHTVAPDQRPEPTLERDSAPLPPEPPEAASAPLEPLERDRQPEPVSESRWDRLFGDDGHDEARKISVREGYGGDESRDVAPRRAPVEPADTTDREPPRFWRDAEAVQFSAWGPGLSTGDDGRIAPVFELTEAVGAYRVVVEGVSEDGLLGRGEAVITVDAPLSVATTFPETLSGGDAVALPVTVRNTHDEELDVQVDVEVEGAAQVGEGLDTFEVEVPEKSTLTRYVPITVEDRRGEVVVDVWAQGGGFIDGQRRTTAVEPRGVERTQFVSGTLPGSSTVELALDDMSESGAEARLAIYTGVASKALEGVAEMDRRPLGCFEQTSARHHVNLLVWEYLSRTGELDEATKNRLHHRIVDGYRVMVDYEVDGGGFEWFGSDEPRAHLTAWALVQFTKMDEVFGAVDPAIVERSVDFLESLARVDGSYDDGSHNAWGEMSDQRRRASELFVTYGVARAGLASKFEPQMKVARTVATEGDQVYEVALAAAALAAADDDSEALDEAMSHLRGFQRDNGLFAPDTGHSWAGGYGGALAVETTGLAVKALIEGGGDEEAIEAAMEWLYRARAGSAWWGSTQATAMALKAGIAAEDDGGEFRDTIEVYVDGESVLQETVSSAELTPRVFTDLGSHLDRESSKIEIRADVPVDYDFEVRWREGKTKTDSDDDPREPGPLDFGVHIPDDTDLTMGDEVSLNVELENRRDQGLGMVVVRLAIAGGLGVSDRELDALVERSPVDYYETVGREIRLYIDEFGAGKSQSLRLSATADVPGAFEIPPSVAYPYYGDDSQWVWSDAGEMAVHLPRP